MLYSVEADSATRAKKEIPEMTKQEVSQIRKHIEKSVNHKIYCEVGLCVAPLPDGSELSFVVGDKVGSFDIEKVTWPINVDIVRDSSTYHSSFAVAQNVADAKRIFDLTCEIVKIFSPKGPVS
jgi:hypothetical protein